MSANTIVAARIYGTKSGSPPRIGYEKVSADSTNVINRGMFCFNTGGSITAATRQDAKVLCMALADAADKDSASKIPVVYFDEDLIVEANLDTNEVWVPALRNKAVNINISASKTTIQSAGTACMRISEKSPRDPGTSSTQAFVLVSAINNVSQADGDAT